MYYVLTVDIDYSTVCFKPFHLWGAPFFKSYFLWAAMCTSDPLEEQAARVQHQGTHITVRWQGSFVYSRIQNAPQFVWRRRMMTKNLKTSENLILGYPTFGQMQVGSFLRAWTRCVSQLSFVGSSDSFPSLWIHLQVDGPDHPCITGMSAITYISVGTNYFLDFSWLEYILQISR